MKKVTLFLSKELEESLKKDGEWREAYRVALTFFYELVIYGSSAYDGGPWQFSLAPRHGGDGGGYAKQYCDCHAESKKTKEVFQNAQRVEGRVRLVKNPTHSYLVLDVLIYKRGTKEPFTKDYWWFPRENPQHKVLNPSAA